MRQAVVPAPGQVVLRTIEAPSPGADEVLIRVRRIGICGSDLHVFHGQHPYTPYPVVQGHEVAGVIAQVGSQVRGLAPGEQVTFIPSVTCGHCYSCRHGREHICDSLKVMGFQTGGAAQDLFAVDAGKVFRLPGTVSIDQAALIEPVAVAVHALRRGGSVAGQAVLVLGAGPIGNLVAQVALALGARAVLITDVSDYRLALARQVGIPATVNTAGEDLDAALETCFGPDRADLVMECVGVQETIGQAISQARKGSSIVVVGVFGKKPEVDMGLVQDHELSLVGTLMYQKQDYATAIDLAAGGRLRLDELITHRFPFERFLDAYHTIETARGETMKVMIELD